MFRLHSIFILALGLFVSWVATTSFADVNQKITCMGHPTQFWSWYVPSIEPYPEFRHVVVSGNAQSVASNNTCLIGKRDAQVYCFGEDFGKTLVKMTHDNERIRSLVFHRQDRIDLLAESGNVFSLVLNKSKNNKKWVRFSTYTFSNAPQMFSSIYAMQFAIDVWGRAVHSSGFFPNKPNELAVKIIPIPPTVWVQYASGRFVEFTYDQTTQQYRSLGASSTSHASPKSSIADFLQVPDHLTKQYGPVAEVQTPTGTEVCYRFVSGRVFCEGQSIPWLKSQLKKIKNAISMSASDDRVCVLEQAQQEGVK
jgi:hypothetical protein